MENYNADAIEFILAGSSAVQIGTANDIRRFRQSAGRHRSLHGKARS